MGNPPWGWVCARVPPPTPRNTKGFFLAYAECNGSDSIYNNVDEVDELLRLRSLLLLVRRSVQHSRWDHLRMWTDREEDNGLPYVPASAYRYSLTADTSRITKGVLTWRLRGLGAPSLASRRARRSPRRRSSVPPLIFSKVGRSDRWEVDKNLTPAMCKRIKAFAEWYRQRTGKGLKVIRIGTNGSLWGSADLPKDRT